MKERQKSGIREAGDGGGSGSRQHPRPRHQRQGYYICNDRRSQPLSTRPAHPPGFTLLPRRQTTFNSRQCDQPDHRPSQQAPHEGGSRADSPWPFHADGRPTLVVITVGCPGSDLTDVLVMRTIGVIPRSTILNGLHIHLQAHPSPSLPLFLYSYNFSYTFKSLSVHSIPSLQATMPHLYSTPIRL